jgi:hypothetical protein
MIIFKELRMTKTTTEAQTTSDTTTTSDITTSEIHTTESGIDLFIYFLQLNVFR